MHVFRLAVLLQVTAMAFCLGGCSPELTEPPTETIMLQIEGLVTSASSGAPVAGAAVILGQGGHFTLPRELVQVATDEQGHYEIEQAVVVLLGDCGGSQLWLRVSAADFSDRGGIESTLRPQCVESVQRLDVVLEPGDGAAFD